MRRPLTVIFLSFSAGCVLAWYGQDSLGKLMLWMSVLCISAAFLIYWLERECIGTCILIVFSLVSGAVSMGMELSRAEPLLDKIGQEVTIQGTVVKEKETAYGKSLLLRPEDENDSVWNRSFRRRVWVSVNETGAIRGVEGYHGDEPWNGWRLMVTGIVERPAFSRNPGGFDQKTYLRTMGAQVVIEAKGEAVIVTDATTNLSARFRSLLVRTWTPIMGEKSCGGLMGLLFGTSDSMEDETLEAFQKIGLGHLLAVSGLHVGLVYGAVQKLLGERGRSIGAQILCCIAAICYAGLAGFSASASRAALMIVIHSIGRMIFRPYDMTTSASISGMVILMRQPCQIMSSGFQLSMLAAFGIACVLPRLSYEAEKLADNKRSHVLRWTADHIVPILAIQMVMGPICARRFQCVSLWSLGLNPLCIAVAGLLIPMALGLSCVTVIAESMAFSAMTALLEPVFSLLAWITGSLMTGLMNLGELAAQLPGTFLTSGFPPGMLILYYLGLFTWTSETFYLLLRKHKTRIIAGWITMIILSAHLFPWWTGTSTALLLWTYQDYPIVFVDVGQGDCIHIQTPKGKNILIDGGGSSRKNTGKNTLLPYLLHRGVTSVDLALATHLHQDHFQGLTELAAEIPIKQLGIYEANRYRQEEILKRWSGSGKRYNTTGTELIYLQEGSKITLEENIWIDVLAPPKRSEEVYRALALDDSDENDSCLVFQIHYQGFKVLITGDMGMEGEEQLLEGEADLQTHILKIGHHGSKYSTSEEFLEAAGPEVGAISVGSNYFGHPSERVIELLEKNDIIIGRTDQQGAIIVKRIHRGHADITSGNGELTWRIDLRENK